MAQTVASMVRTGLAMAVALATAAGAWAQQPTVIVKDLHVVEGSSLNWSIWPVDVTLSAPTPSTVTVQWNTVDGSAISTPGPAQDYTPDSGTLIFDPNSTTPRTPLTVSIWGDTNDEWNPAHMDEAFFIELKNPTNAILSKSRATVTIIDDDQPYPPLQFVSAVADGPGGAGRVRLQWRVPPAPPASARPDDVLVRWNLDSNCPAPSTAWASADGQFYLSARAIGVKQPGDTQTVEDSPLPLSLRRCYALFAIHSGTPSAPAFVTATPFPSDSPNSVSWAYSVGTYSVGGAAPAVVPPTVGTDAVYTVDNDGVVHAMTRGADGGTWPETPPAQEAWNPVGLGHPASNRSPVVSQSFGSRLLVGTESGEVYAVDGKNGSIAWSRSARFGNSPLLPQVGGVQATPAGVFQSWGGYSDLILVGTNGTSNNSVYMLDPETGLDKSPAYSDSSMGPIRGMATVDYPPSNRVYLLAASPGGALWAFGLGPLGAPGLSLVTSPVAYPVAFAAGANGSLVLRDGRLYFGLANGDMIAYRLSDGAGKNTPLNLGDGQVKGFMFPDRRNTDLYLSTNNAVWAVRDTLEPLAPNLVPQWQVVLPSPSIALHRPGTNYLYVGGGDGKLYQIDVSSATPQTTKKAVLLESGSQLGAPSLDGPNNLVLVGSVSGVVYAVRADPTTGIP